MRILKGIIILWMSLFIFAGFAQTPPPLPHGTVFGIKPNDIGPIAAEQLEPSMAKKTRVTTAIRGKIIRVTKSKGGWFEIDGGKGKVIAAHFKNYNISLPKALRGRVVIIEGVAQKQFIADDMQHFAGDTVVGKKQHMVNANPKQRLAFEVRGLMVDK
ncbi:DUF4920 domain-containing protein [Mucilaginibacter pedocola]|uniref:DUF4920 domain-containing protein n=1 Tax=Mucilaginibacter pedocola TaxID=1792845 RepID=A0A1S9PJX8_9SPHI|nr:DUF4920 domain-containing protein [Mucilaginibacter pedocola]OOQ61261.1 hypothetical protein BC343_19935 [Mucilaginibacter pedocola]